ncbi:MAG: hypothetical protein DRQ48_06855 [Gammaproteobacteria bacterium]|nr:MAG: hypothetical protein DRQ48_06855 [Gammaproteobacteria bacterium]RKZ70525.1 MAG: hypothetical protein DRQ44_00585 [Gammaproteobacteria bacterium]
MSKWEIVDDQAPAGSGYEILDDNQLQGQGQSQDSQNGFWGGVDKLNQFGDKYLAPVGAGVYQGAGDMAASVGNLALMPFTDKRIPHPELKQHLTEKGGMQDALFLGGEIGGSLPAAGAAFKAASKVIPQIGKGAASMLGANVGRGAATGYATGEGTPMGRGGSAALGGALTSLAGTGSKAISEALTTAKNKALAKSSSLYKSVFKEAEKAGVKDVKVPKINMDDIVGYATKKDMAGVDKYIKSPTLNNAHDAQSDLGKIGRALDKKKVASGLSSSENKALASVEDAKRRIRGSMQTAITKKDPTLAKKYSEATKDYRDNVLPYLKLKPLSKVTSKTMKEGKLPSAVAKSDEFMLAKGAEHPEIALRELGKALGKKSLYLGAAGAGGFGGKKAYDTLFE